MRLFAKEQVPADRVAAAADRFRRAALIEAKDDADSGGHPLLRWARLCCHALKKRAKAEASEEESKLVARLPEPPTDVMALANGGAAAAVVALYCPEAVDWRDAVGAGGAVLAAEFASSRLPSLRHPSADEAADLRGSSVGSELALAALADLFVVLEEHPFDITVVKRPGESGEPAEGERSQANLPLNFT